LLRRASSQLTKELQFFFWLDPKETKSQGFESSAVKFILEF